MCTGKKKGSRAAASAAPGQAVPLRLRGERRLGLSEPSAAGLPWEPCEFGPGSEGFPAQSPYAPVALSGVHLIWETGKVTATLHGG